MAVPGVSCTSRRTLSRVTSLTRKRLCVCVYGTL
jgi:hypothetical protein